MADGINPGYVPQVPPTLGQAPVAPEIVAPVAPVTPVAPVAPDPMQYQVPQPVISNRTQEQIEKLVASNQRLHDELLRRGQVPPQVVPINPDDFVTIDPESGQKFVDDQKLKERMNEVTNRATRAEQALHNYIQSNEQREIDRQNREAFASYPELNPTITDKFNKEFSNRTRSILIDSVVYPGDYGGRPLSFKEAADLAKGATTQPKSDVEEEDDKKEAREAKEKAQKAQEARDLKMQASAEVGNQPPQARFEQDDEDLHRKLSEATRYGDEEALAARIRMSDHIRVREET